VNEVRVAAVGVGRGRDESAESKRTCREIPRVPRASPRCRRSSNHQSPSPPANTGSS
jgi:hypothetical protein